MSSFARCRKCGSYDFIDRHNCPPAWLVWLEHEDPPDEVTAYGYDAERAVAKYCEEYDSGGDYTIIQAGEAVAFAKRHGTDDEPVRYAVSAESVPEYTAREHRP